MELWNFFDGEPFLDNPVMVINPKKRRVARRHSTKKARSKVMAFRIRRGVKRSPARRRRSYKRNFYTAAVANPPRRRRRSSSARIATRRRSYRHNPIRVGRVRRRRGFRRNPGLLSFGGGSILGFPIKDIVKAGIAVVAFPIAANQLRKLLPASLSSGSTGRWVTNIGAAVGIGFLAKKTLGPEAGRIALIALGANLLADAVAEFLPSVANFGMSYYPQRGMVRNGGTGLRAFNTAGSRGSFLPSSSVNAVERPFTVGTGDPLRLVR